MKNIEDVVFKNCINLKSVKLPCNLKTIGSNAFYHCVSLEEIYIPDSVVEIGTQAFGDCSGLKKVTLSKRLECINKSLFYNCKSLSEIIIPDNVRLIGKKAFYCCLSLKKITFGKRCSTIGEEAFERCENLNILKNFKRICHIHKGAFKYCISLKEITIPSNVSFLPEYAFFHCENLVKVILPCLNSFNISVETFGGCYKLESINLPDLINDPSNHFLSVSPSAFNNCESLENACDYAGFYRLDIKGLEKYEPPFDLGMEKILSWFTEEECQKILLHFGGSDLYDFLLEYSQCKLKEPDLTVEEMLAKLQ